MNTPKQFQTTVVEQNQLSAGMFELSMTRCDFHFKAGHEIHVHGKEATSDRTYSLSSGESDEHLRILYRVIPDGLLTPQLAKLAPGDVLPFTGPFGNFLLRDENHPIVFIATGTGIAPALSFIRTCPALDLTLLHGVRVAKDLSCGEGLPWTQYRPCTSREPGPGFHGRVTSFLLAFDLDPTAHYYLCGSNDMIQAVRTILRDRGIENANILAEAYYYW